jgi:excisionase family DNA binding protein
MGEVAEATHLLTSRQAARRLGVSPDTIRALGKSGVLPAIRYGERGQYRFRAQDVEALLRPRSLHDRQEVAAA